MDIEIREITAQDYSEVLLLWNNELGYRNINVEQLTEQFERMKPDSNYKTFVAVFDYQVVGFISVAKIMAVEHENGYLKINGLAVLESVQHKGIGSKLLIHAEAYAKENGVTRIILNSGFQRTDAHAFYESKGYDKRSYCFSKNINR